MNELNYEMYNEEILDYLKKGYSLSFYPSRVNPSIVIRVQKEELASSKLINFIDLEQSAYPDDFMYRIVRDALRDLRRELNE